MKSAPNLLVAVIVLAAGAAHAAQTKYTIQGLPFNDFSVCENCAPLPGLTALTVMFTVNEPLPNDSVLFDATPFLSEFSFSDGVTNVTHLTPGYNGGFHLTTVGGVITGWDIAWGASGVRTVGQHVLFRALHTTDIRPLRSLTVYCAKIVKDENEEDFCETIVARNSTNPGMITVVSAPALKVLRVANEGIDSAFCGGSHNKCRSISQAIRNASNGDIVVVEPGLYGDLNRNGIIGEPGEESGDPGCDCLIHVNKRLTILSDDGGTAATIIDASSTDLTGIHISVSDVLFGFAGYGFTIRGSSANGTNGIFVDISATARIWGNRVIRSSVGINARNSAVFDNEVIETIDGPGIAGGRRIIGNVVSLGQAEGIIIGQGIVDHNMIIDNGGAGLVIMDPAFAEVTRNAIIHNREEGIKLPVGNPDARNDVVIVNNNIIGNNYEPASSDGELHCGIRNRTGGFIWAADNYWGTLGVANHACDGPLSTTITIPMRQEPRTIRLDDN